jgi:hypothetical protein
MFTTFMDDSGTAPENKVAIAAGIVFPVQQLRRFQSQWDNFRYKFGFSDFHAAECLARNRKSEFANWSDDKVRRAFARVRAMTFKYSVKGFCIAIFKKDYDEVLTADLRAAVGNSHYTWAVSSVIGLAHDWAAERNVPMEYVFDTATKDVRREIDASMEYAETNSPGKFVGHYFFRNRKEVPALQATDLFAWTCFQAACKVRIGKTPHAIAHESATAYHSAQGGEWWVVQSLNREGIEKWVAENKNSERTQQIIAFKEKLKAARQP